MMPFGNLLLWTVLAGVGCLVVGVIISAVHTAAEARLRRKCRRNHRRVISRRSNRPAITLNARCSAAK